MDMITLAMAKNYTDSQRLAYIETGAVYTFNDNSEGKEFNGTQVKIADVAPDLNNLAKVVGLMGGQQLEILKDDFEIVTADGEPQIQYAIYQETAIVSVYKGALWVFCNPESEGYYVTSIEFADTIHPIDPKYLPGVCLPVVELTTTFASGADLTEEEDKLLKAAWENDTPIVVKCAITLENNGGYDYCSAVWYKASVDLMSAFALSFGTKTLLIYSVDNGETWGCLVS